MAKGSAKDAAGASTGAKKRDKEAAAERRGAAGPGHPAHPAARIPARRSPRGGTGADRDLDHSQDEIVAARLLEALEFRHGIDVSTLDLSLRSGRVMVRGVLSDSDELDSLKETIRDEQGVTDLECSIQIAPTRREEDRDQARAIQEALDSSPDFGESDIQVACLSRIAVLRGTVPSNIRKVTAGILALRQENVLRVRNRLVVVADQRPTSAR